MRGPPPRYKPTFTETEIEEAERILRTHSAPQSHVQRARLALVIAKRPDISSVEAGKIVGWHSQTILKWRRRWEKEGFTLADAPRSGRPPTFSPS